jgi:adenosylcobinamide kinase / adenosylcobinamide-phosphate guanylyltransferase
MPEHVLKETVLFTGGVRSGKSRLAREWVEAHPGPRTFVATAQRYENDAEFATRIKRHQDERGRLWADTAEVQVDIIGAMECAAHVGTQSVVIDCVTLWLTSLGMHYQWDEQKIFIAVDELAQFLRTPPLHVALVTNEVGSGIVPETPLGRQFRDLQGFANQRLAAAVQSVVLVVCGLPWWLKKKEISL